MRLLVTGTEGQLARSLVDRAAGFPDVEVVVLGRPGLDLADPAASSGRITALRPDLVVNAAAYTAVDQAEDDIAGAQAINADAPRALATIAADIGAGFVQISTDYVFDGSQSGARREDDPVAPLGVYGRTKLAGERNAQAANPATTIIRTAWVYSPFGKNFVRTMMALAQTRDVLTVVGDQIGNPSCALDVADGLLTLARRRLTDPGAGAGEVYHLAGSGSTSWADFARAIMDECTALDLPDATVTAIASDAWPTRAPRPRNSRLDSGKFARDFGYIAPDWHDSVRAVIRRLAA